jgi:hypothetical protein
LATRTPRAWRKDATEAVRDRRFAPVAGRAIAISKELRLQRRMDLGAVKLGGSAAKRHVALKVTGLTAQARRPSA